MMWLLARLAGWLTRKANLRYVFIAERPDGVWEELFRVPSWMLPHAGEPYYPYRYAESDVRAVYLDMSGQPIPPGRPAHGKKVVLVDTQPERRKPPAVNNREGDR